jgi:hypothetical protein
VPPGFELFFIGWRPAGILYRARSGMGQWLAISPSLVSRIRPRCRIQPATGTGGLQWESSHARLAAFWDWAADMTPRLVEGNVNRLLCRPDRFPIHQDAIGLRVGFGAQVGYLSIDGYLSK